MFCHTLKHYRKKKSDIRSQFATFFNQIKTCKNDNRKENSLQKPYYYPKFDMLL